MNFFKDIFSTFLPENILIASEVISVTKGNKTVSELCLNEIQKIYFVQKHIHTGAQVLIIWDKGTSHSYFQNQRGFSDLVEYVLLQMQISSISAADLLYGGKDLSWKVDSCSDSQ